MHAEMCCVEELMIKREIGAEVEREGFEQGAIPIHAYDADLARRDDDKPFVVNRKITRSTNYDMGWAAHRQWKWSTTFPTPCFIRPAILATQDRHQFVIREPKEPPNSI